ncbi:hypothetical protein ILYODFUR_000374 [Ilyodon furcidens]|uniref:Uncharacterized protein n=1 Tax=Ilyodon furcidens TaxID=33524 RepID=A0ABV0SI78_9TELE
MAPSPDEDGGRRRRVTQVRAGLALVWAGAGPVCLSPPPEGKRLPPGSGGQLPLWGIGTLTWEYRVCMGSVSESSRSIVVCVSVFMCTDEGGNVLCRASAWGVMCPEVSGPWSMWICSGKDGCRRDLWARRCSSLGLLHCGCWVVPLGLSPALLCWESPGDGYPGAPVLWGLLDVYGSDLLRTCPRSRGAGPWLLTLNIAYFYRETCIHKCAYTQIPRCLDSGVNRYINVLY